MVVSFCRDQMLMNEDMSFLIFCIGKPLFEEKCMSVWKKIWGKFSRVAFLMAALMKIEDNTTDSDNEFITTADKFGNVSLPSSLIKFIDCLYFHILIYFINPQLRPIEVIQIREARKNQPRSRFIFRPTLHQAGVARFSAVFRGSHRNVPTRAASWIPIPLRV